MPKFVEKRQHPRIEARIQVTFRSLAEVVQAYTRNVSTGGVFLKTDCLLDPNAEIELVIAFPQQHGSFRVLGRVVRVMSVSHPEDIGKQLFGVGIAFIDPDPKMLSLIERAVASCDSSFNNTE